MESMMVREGYLFAGWYTDKERTQKINPGWTPQGTFTLYEKWIPILYPVRYKLNGGFNTRRNPRFISVEDGIRKLYPARKKGHTFLGWFLNGERTEFLPEGIQEPVELEARFSSPARVRFFTNGGGLICEKMTDSNGLLDPFPSPKRMGYQFTGWFKDRLCRHPFHWKERIEENLNLYAGWEVLEYRIEYDLQGGRLPEDSPRIYTYESASFLLPRPFRNGYRFLGWEDSRGNPVRLVRRYTMGNLYLKAVWKKEHPEVHVVRTA